ncbi:S-adenosyl-L-methionine-dependent methyltransferase [Mytilinidion resinicola]|uniref:S-adenosyl-L-methionine-dependent methyltransferase n=1 Tax=Mytilinidion resinicola TaxID=574789 RepID=A0A6A6YK45_9PEZI|nr:S-adenosyl-L-methionine-dependent methyltransferase [Mytilinidion resinicola]KAF2808335.1 S-adenosyl-L-methionine-dependent methyltransferase [Mytilinidion resinicola]
MALEVALASSGHSATPRRASGGSKSDKSVSPARQQLEYTAQETADALDQAEQGIDVESAENFSDDDGYQTDSSESDSVSLVSSARNFIYENGRRYHGYKRGENDYSFPNDDREQDREDLKHAMFLLLFNKTLHFAPLENQAMKVIDLGTGTGIWALDFADQYPLADVLGVDLSPIQSEFVPPNLRYMVDDVEAEWLYPVNHFDYIHTRHTIQAFRNWPLLYSRALQHLKPGAWMECQELTHYPECDDGSMAPDNPIAQFWGYIIAALSNLGVNLRPRLADLMRDAGFINVTERIFYTPIGPWPKNRALQKVGLYWRAVLVEGLEAIALGPMTKGLGWRKEEVEVFLVGVRKAYLEKGTHTWMPFHVIYGQKPGYA